MRITLNGNPTDVPDDARLLDVTGPLADGTAIAVAGAVVPRSRLHVHALADGDVVEVVTAVAGG